MDKGKTIKLDSDIYLLKQLIVMADDLKGKLDKHKEKQQTVLVVNHLSDLASKKLETIRNGMSDVVSDLEDKNKRE